MSASANLALPFIEGGELLPDVTLNETLRLIDTLVQLAIVDRDLNTPPGSPVEGQRWIVKASPSPSGAWAGHGNHIAAWQDGGWVFCAPKVGWFAYVIDEGALVAWSGRMGHALRCWRRANMAHARLGPPPHTNPFSAKLNKPLGREDRNEGATAIFLTSEEARVRAKRSRSVKRKFLRRAGFGSRDNFRQGLGGRFELAGAILTRSTGNEPPGFADPPRHSNSMRTPFDGSPSRLAGQRRRGGSRERHPSVTSASHMESLPTSICRCVMAAIAHVRAPPSSHRCAAGFATRPIHGATRSSLGAKTECRATVRKRARDALASAAAPQLVSFGLKAQRPVILGSIRNGK